MHRIISKNSKAPTFLVKLCKLGEGLLKRESNLHYVHICAQAAYGGCPAVYSRDTKQCNVILNEIHCRQYISIRHQVAFSVQNSVF